MIVGASDKGKSSLLRALGCVAVGEPDGQELIRHDEAGYAIQLVLPGHTVVRKRGKGGNYYVLDGVKLVRDRSDWPPANVLNVVRLCPDNFQWQLDGPLWFLDSAGTVAKQLNKVVDLEAIDAVLREADRQAKEAVAKQEGAVQEYEAAKHAHQSLKWVPAMLAAAERVRERKGLLDKTQVNRERLAGLIDRHRKLAGRKISDDLFAAFAAVKAKRQEADDIGRRAADLASVIKRHTTLQRRLDRVGTFVPAWRAIADFRERGEALSAKTSDLRNALDRYDDLQREADQCQQRLSEAKAELAAVERCPACGQPTNLTGSPSCAPTYTSATSRRRPG